MANPPLPAQPSKADASPILRGSMKTHFPHSKADKPNRALWRKAYSLNRLARTVGLSRKPIRFSLLQNGPRKKCLYFLSESEQFRRGVWTGNLKAGPETIAACSLSLSQGQFFCRGMNESTQTLSREMSPNKGIMLQTPFAVNP